MHKLDSSTSCQRTKPFRAFPFFFFFLAFQAFWTEKVKIEFENLIFLPVWWSSKRKKIPRERAHAQTATHTERVPLSLSFFLSLSKCGPFPTWNRSDCDSIHPEVHARPRARIFGRDYACHQWSTAVLHSTPQSAKQMAACQTNRWTGTSYLQP